ncbi:MAG: hypothetical protein IT244_00215 [Bacteroidia bacterium]|nr:hypothetical protein [Bacteroidia bacterium]
MKKYLVPVAFAILVSSCSSVKKGSTTANYDDAYFTPAEIDQKGSVYGKTNPNMFRNDAIASSSQRTTRSYGQSYSDRFRNFGSSNVTPVYTPAMVYTNRGMGVMMVPNYGSPYMGGYNPYGYNPYSRYGYNPYMGMGYNPYCMYGYDPYYNPSWSYWNQYYSPYNYNYWGSGNVGGSTGSGSSWSSNSGSSNSGTHHSYNNNGGTRRNSYNSGLPSSSQSSRTGSSGSSGSSSSSGSGYTRPSYSSPATTTGSGGTYTRPSSSGSSGSTGGAQSGSSSRRR